MTLTPEGGAALPVSVTTTRKVQGGAAIPVYGYMTAPTDGRPAMGGSAVPVRVLTAADLKENGGMWTLEGRPYAMPVYTAPAGVTVQGGPALAVYPVNAWPTVAVAPAFVPTDLAGLRVWLKADAGLYKDAAKAQPCTADADAVYTWADQSGNGNDAIQATAAARPLYKVNIQNGLPVVRFDGTNDSLAGAMPAGAAKTVFLVAKKRSAPAVDSQYAYNLSTSNLVYAALYASSVVSATGWDWYPNQASASVVLGGTATACSSVTMKFASAAAVTPYINAVAGSAFDPGDGYSTSTTLTLGAHPLGGTSFGDFDIAEFLIYDTALSDANRVLVETYLNTRWAGY